MQNISLDKEDKAEALNQIKSFFLAEYEKEVSDFKASGYLDFILQEIGPVIYNQAIRDTHQFMLTKVEEIYDLEKHAR